MYLRKPEYGYNNIIYIHVDVTEVIPVPQEYQRMLKSAKEDLKKKPWHVRREHFHTREIPSNTGHDASMKVAEDWLRECKENHKLCQHLYGNTRPGWCPKRLVAVGKDDNQISLVELIQE